MYVSAYLRNILKTRMAVDSMYSTPTCQQTFRLFYVFGLQYNKIHSWDQVYNTTVRGAVIWSDVTLALPAYLCDSIVVVTTGLCSAV